MHQNYDATVRDSHGKLGAYFPVAGWLSVMGAILINGSS